MKTWHHGHSTLVGVVIGVLLSRHLLDVVVVSLLTGFLLREISTTATRISHAIASRLRH